MPTAHRLAALTGPKATLFIRVGVGTGIGERVGCYLLPTATQNGRTTLPSAVLAVRQPRHRLREGFVAPSGFEPETSWL